MKTTEPHNDRKGIFLISGLAAVIGGLCCVTPVVLILLGLSTLAFANSLGNVLYGEYRWAFRAAALVFLALTLWVYFRRRGICTLERARRQRNRIINISVLVLIFAVGMYIFLTYFAVHYWGIRVGLPWAQYDESWALPASAAVLAVGAMLYFVRFRGSHEE
jgi:choline-glycine betaine transporter